MTYTPNDILNSGAIKHAPRLANVRADGCEYCPKCNAFVSTFPVLLSNGKRMLGVHYAPYPKQCLGISEQVKP